MNILQANKYYLPIKVELQMILNLVTLLLGKYLRNEQRRLKI